jgi:hypothetical protein
MELSVKTFVVSAKHFLPFESGQMVSLPEMAQHIDHPLPQLIASATPTPLSLILSR